MTNNKINQLLIIEAIFYLILIQTHMFVMRYYKMNDYSLFLFFSLLLFIKYELCTHHDFHNKKKKKMIYTYKRLKSQNMIHV